MDLGLTKRGDYVVRAAVSLARAAGSGEYRKVREVAGEMNLPLRYTPHILNLLVKAGLAEARAGQKGGYRLLRPPEDISVLEVVEAGEGSLRPTRCTLRGGPCRWQQMCAVHPALDEAYESLTAVLRSRSLASILEVDAQLAAVGNATAVQ